MIHKGDLQVRALEKGWGVYGSVLLGTRAAGKLRTTVELYRTHSRSDAKAFLEELQTVLTIANGATNPERAAHLRAWLRENLLV